MTRKKTTTAPDYKNRQIEMLVNRMKRREQKSATVLVPPIPISMSALVPDSGGLLGTAFMPVAGQIVLIAVHVDAILSMDKEFKPTITVRMTNDQYDNTKTYEVKSGFNRFEEELFIPEGSKLYVVVNEPVNFRGVWFAAMYQIETKYAARSQVALDDILKDE